MKEKNSSTINKNLKGIKNHKKAAAHLQAAAHHEEGNHQKAEQSTIAAHRQVTLSNKTQKAGKQNAIIGNSMAI